MGHLQRVVLAAGGTAGHVFPALAIRSGLIERGVDVRLYVDERGLAWLDGVDRAHIEVVPSGGLVTGSIPKRAANIVKLARGLVRSWQLLRRDRPDLVIGLGGYASVGPVVAARRLAIASVLHEQNSVMGVANRFTARHADAVALTFEPTEGAQGPCTVTGNPSRPGIVAIGGDPYPTPAEPDRLGILVIGGSQGARVVSDRVPAALAALPDALRTRLQVVHQARPEDHARVCAAYADAGIDAVVEPFVDVPAALPTTHLVIARSGATTVCDVAVARRPAIYLPLLTHADLQQVKNAAAVVAAGGARLCREDECGVEELAAMTEQLLADPDRLRAMADAARAWSRPDAADAILAIVSGGKAVSRSRVVRRVRAASAGRRPRRGLRRGPCPACRR